MYNVRFIQHIHSCFASMSTSDIFLEKDIVLPFIPFDGLDLKVSEDLTIPCKSITDYGGKEPRRVELEIVYDVYKQRFDVYLPSNTEIYWAQLNRKNHRTVTEIAKEYIKDGWQEKK